MKLLLLITLFTLLLNISCTIVHLQTNEIISIQTDNKCVQFTVSSQNNTGFSFYLVPNTTFHEYEADNNRTLLYNNDKFSHQCINMIECSATVDNLTNINYVVLTNSNVHDNGTYVYNSNLNCKSGVINLNFYGVVSFMLASVLVCIMLCCCLCCVCYLYKRITSDFVTTVPKGRTSNKHGLEEQRLISEEYLG